MNPANCLTIDGNEAAASIAYRLSETIAIYPITPSTPMGELADEWAGRQKTNIWGTIPSISEMQSEAGVAGAIHGMLQAGSLSTTFTASQGLLLMIPDMLKIAGELSPFVLHVAARSLATHALSIFGDHSDVMAVRQTGFALLASNSPQEAHDMAMVSHAATLASRVPFLHFFDGFRTSHELNQVELISDEILFDLIDPAWIRAHSDRALTPDAPRIRGTAQNPDTFFQAREAINPFYAELPRIVQEQMDRLAARTGRAYSLFEYEGPEDAESLIIMMGSGAETASQTIAHLNNQGRKLGLLKVRLYRPFSAEAFLDKIPASVRRIAVLDRTKEPGALGEPLFQDVVTCLAEAGRHNIRIIGGRYGLSSKEFTPPMVRDVYDELEKENPRPRFTVGINDDVTKLSLEPGDPLDIREPDTTRAIFFGLGSDGTVGANKNTIKILGSKGKFAQGYFVYDSKKSGATTVSHLRFGPHPIRAPYLIQAANFIGCHQWSLLEQYNITEHAAQDGVILLNSAYDPDTAWDKLPQDMQEQIIEKNLRVFVIDAYAVAQDAGMGGRINTIMQTCFFAISNIIPKEEALNEIKRAIEKTYQRKGAHIVEKNIRAVDASLESLQEIDLNDKTAGTLQRPPVVSEEAPDFVKQVTSVMLRGQGDLLPVSAFPIDGTWPVGTTRWEKRNLATEIPVWDPDLCIQCNKCSMVCPHAAVRGKFYPDDATANAPDAFKSTKFRSRDYPDHGFTIQIAPEDCTGCMLCVTVCPAKDKSNPKHKALDRAPLAPIRDQERKNFSYFLDLPEADRSKLDMTRYKDVMFAEPLFEFSGACAGCGETPYIKYLTQLAGDRSIIANATGCSSIYGGNLPTTPYTTDAEGRGPAWSNSLFEDNAEYGFGIRIAVDKKNEQARDLLQTHRTTLGTDLVDGLLEADQTSEAGIAEQRQRVVKLRENLPKLDSAEASRLHMLADYLVRKSVWIVGGDGWAYDIGYGGLDHVMAQGRNINILVLDTEVYSNTGGQASKSTPIGAVAKFAVQGKEQRKKDLGLLAMSYGNVYVARVAFGASDTQTARAFAEADAYPGTSLIIAYSHCIAHGYSLHLGLDQQKRAVDSGYWPLYRYDPRRREKGEALLKLDSGKAKIRLRDFMENETRFRMLQIADPNRAKELANSAQAAIDEQRHFYEQLALKTEPPKTE
jgi:pyruvate-ferredoxin/flavodoxin oxidoreductase